jgi:uncharacterized protein with WD repeat
MRRLPCQQGIRGSKFSPDGRLFAWVANDGLVVVDAETRVQVMLIERKGLQEFSFSPLGRYLATFERQSRRKLRTV